MPSTLNYFALKHTKFNAYSFPNSQLISGEGSNGLKVQTYVVQKITSTGLRLAGKTLVMLLLPRVLYSVNILWAINFADLSNF